MCKHGTTALVKVRIPADLSCSGKARIKQVAIDSCIAQIVEALQNGEVDMRGSCCGHGKGTGHIDLQDGRGLLVLNAEQNRQFINHGGTQQPSGSNSRSVENQGSLRP